jgi:hypothetical protein
MDGGADRYYVRAGSEAVHPVRFAHQDGVALAEESLSPVIRIQGTVHQTSSFGHFWRGSIAKGGSPVCRARCLPIKKGIEIPLYVYTSLKSCFIKVHSVVDLTLHMFCFLLQAGRC